MRFGTRGSALALAQTDLVVDRLRVSYPDVRAEIRIIQTEGDLNQTAPLTEIGGRGVFTNAIERRILSDEVDAAVHSAKDLPSALHPDVPIVAIPNRDDPRDVLVSRHGVTLERLPRNPVIGTSSRRPEVQIRHLRPDARVVSIRGNLDTRLRKAEGTGLDAVVLAAAGIRRMGWEDRICERFAVERLVPSPGQGAIAIQARAGSGVAHLLATLDDPQASWPVQIERAFLGAIGAGCVTPVGAFVSARGDGYQLVAMLADETGSRIAFANERLTPGEEQGHAAEVARLLQAEVGGSRSRPGIGWAGESGDLRGVRVVVTRPRRQAGELMAALAKRGAEPLPLPTIRIEPAADPSALDDALRGAARGEFDWIAFTSVNGVEAVVERLAALEVEAARLGGVKVAAIGRATANAVKEAGLGVAFVPSAPTGAALANELLGLLEPGARVLYPRSAIGRDALPETLRDAGVDVTVIDAYQTAPEPDIDPGVLDQVRRGEVDVVTFSSPSSARNLLALFGGDARALSTLPAICSGPVTAQAVREAGLLVAAVSAGPSAPAMAEAVATYWRGRGDTSEREHGIQA